MMEIKFIVLFKKSMFFSLDIVLDMEPLSLLYDGHPSLPVL